MVTYEVTTIVDPRLVEAYERYMRHVHIPDLLATGCFHGAALTRSATGRYRVRYEAPTEADLEHYLANHAPRLREDVASHFPEGVTASREVWVEIQSWGTTVSMAEAQTTLSRGRHRLPLDVLPDTLAVCRLPPDAALPAWASVPMPFLTISRTSEELSITTRQSAVPPSVRCEPDYRALRVRGTLPPDLVGILMSIAEPLAQAGLSIFAISTYDTDYVLVKAGDLPVALETLRKAGHKVNS